jgi:copper ion binding protein
MRSRLRLPGILLCAALSLMACRSSEPNQKVMRVEIAVGGMTCDSCVQGITHEVGRLDGVRSVEVDLESGKAVVVYAEGEIDAAALEQKIEELGYTATPAEPVVAEP